MNFIRKCQKNEKLKRFLTTVQMRIMDAEITTSSAAIAYYLLLSLFPLVIAIGNVLPFLSINPESILPYIEALVPKPIFSMLDGTITSLLVNSNGGLLSISAIATLWAASRSINALQKSLNKVYGVGKRSNMLITRLFSFVTVFFFLIAVVIMAIIFTIGQYILDYVLPIFQLSPKISGLFSTLKWPVTMVILFITMLIIYFIIPNAKVRFRSVIPGAIFATVGWMLLTQFFGLYVKYFSNGLTSYGLIGSFIVFMLWLNFSATVILIGGVINATNEEYMNGTIETRDNRIGLIKESFIHSSKKEKEGDLD